MVTLVKHSTTPDSGRSPAAVAAVAPGAGWTPLEAPSHLQVLHLEPSHGGAAVASADEGQMQFLLSALRVALGKKEAALVSVADQLATAQGRLQQCEAQKAKLAGQLQDLQHATSAVPPERLPAATSVTPGGRLLAQARHELGRESARAAELAAERDTLQQDVALLRQQLVAAAQAEAVERERLCGEATQGRLLARARARQVDQLQRELQEAKRACTNAGAAAVKEAEAARAEAARAVTAAAQASARAAAAEAEAAQLRQQLNQERDTSMKEEARALAAEADLAETRQQMDWQALRIAELQQSSGMGQLMRRYEGEVHRLRTQFDAERSSLKAQLVQAQAQARDHQQQQQQQPHTSGTNLPELDSSAWQALFDDEEPPQQLAARVHSASTQTEAHEEQQQVQGGSDPAELLEAAEQEIERLHELNSGLDASLQEAHSQAQHAQQAALDQQQQAAAAIQREHQITLDAVRRSEAGLRQRLSTAELQLTHRSGELHALREAKDKLELALAALKDELDSLREAPRQDVEELRGQLLQAVGHTQALEAQVQQMKQASLAAATAQPLHKLDAETGWAGAHDQQAAARSELATLQQVQAQPDQEHIRWQAMHGTCGPAMTASSVEADVQPPASEPDPIRALARQSLPPLQPCNIQDVRQLPSEASSGCQSPARCSSISSRSPGALPMGMTAKQLQLELARVRIAPAKPLTAGSGMSAGSWAWQAVPGGGSSRIDHASDFTNPRMSGMAALRQALGSVGSLSGGGGNGGQGTLLSSDREEERRGEEDDSCFATPLAQTPPYPSTSELSPFALGSGAQQEQGQPRRLGRLRVPALNLDRIKPDLSPEPRHTRLAAPGSSDGMSDGLDSASTSVSSPSSRPSTTRTLPAAARGVGGRHAPLHDAIKHELPPSSNFVKGLSGGTSTGWTSASLDASLSRLAKLTAGLLPGRQ